MSNKNKKWSEILVGFDLDRIRQIPISEKFRMVEVIKLLARETEYAREHGYKKLKESTYFKEDQTYALICNLFVEDANFYEIKEIVLNYLTNYKFSDVYYSKFAIVGIGVMMIQNNRDPYSVFNTLLSLLGNEFLTYNFKIAGYKEAIETNPQIENIIRYKEYQELYLDYKFDLLALGILRDKKGLEAVEDYIINYMKDPKIELYFKLLNDMNHELLYRSYHYLKEDATDLDEMILAGLYCVLSRRNIMISHYMMNSCIGKYDHFHREEERIIDDSFKAYDKMILIMEGENK